MLNVMNTFPRDEWIPHIRCQHSENLWWIYSGNILKCYENLPAPEIQNISPLLVWGGALSPILNDSPYQSIVAPFQSFTARLENTIGSSVLHTGITKKVLPRFLVNCIVDENLGWKIDDKSIVQFGKIWTAAVVRAKQLGSALFVDPEPYRNYLAYDSAYIATKNNIEVAELTRRIHQLAAEMMTAITAHYPDIIIWSAFTRLYDETCTAPERILFEELLRLMAISQSTAKVITGGTSQFQRCSLDMDELETRISTRHSLYESVIQRFPNLVLGVSTALWHDVSLKAGYYLLGICGASTFLTLTDFVPKLRRLFAEFEAVWVYTNLDTGYNPSDPKIASLYNAAIREAMA